MDRQKAIAESKTASILLLKSNKFMLASAMIKRLEATSKVKTHAGSLVIKRGVSES